MDDPAHPARPASGPACALLALLGAFVTLLPLAVVARAVGAVALADVSGALTLAAFVLVTPFLLAWAACALATVALRSALRRLGSALRRLQARRSRDRGPYPSLYSSQRDVRRLEGKSARA